MICELNPREWPSPAQATDRRRATSPYLQPRQGLHQRPALGCVGRGPCHAVCSIVVYRFAAAVVMWWWCFMNNRNSRWILFTAMGHVLALSLSPTAPSSPFAIAIATPGQSTSHDSRLACTSALSLHCLLAVPRLLAARQKQC